MPHIDISTIHLSKSELCALTGISNGVIPDKSMQNRLLQLRLIEWDYRARSYRISPYGIEYLEYQRHIRKKSLSDSARYWITTCIALAALIKSFLPEISAVWVWLSKLLAR